MRIGSRLFFVLVTLVIMSGRASAQAPTAISFRVTPLMTDLSIAPGTTQTNLITVFNTAPAGQAPLHIKITGRDWTLDPTGNMITLDAGKADGGCGLWLQIDPIELTIPAGQSQIVRYTCTVPADAQGSYHSVILFTSDPEPGTYKGDAVLINACIGDTVYVQVGPTVRRAKVAALTLDPNDVVLTVLNTGSSYIRLGGLIKITDASGTDVEDVKVPGDAVLPGNASTRIVTLKLPSPLQSGSYTVTALLDYGGDAILGARINATLP